jgi:hypothetical protein
LNRRIVQPDHSSFAVIELGAIVIVGFDVSVDERVRVIGIGFVEMLRRQSIEDDEARRERDSEDRPPERPHHLLIMDEKRGACHADTSAAGVLC